MGSVLVLDGAQRSALAITRSLGRAGIDVITAESAQTHLCSQSRYSRRSLIYPNPEADCAAFIDCIRDLTTRYAIDLIIPVTDITTNALVEHRAAFAGSTRLVVPDLETYERLTDKYALIQVARELGVPAPRSVLVDPTAGGALPAPPSWPVVLKPTRSRYRLQNRWLSTAVKIVETPEALAETVAACSWFATHPYMMQECIAGEGQGIFALYNRGEAVCFFAHRRIREKPPWGGVSVKSESVEPDPTLLAHARRILDRVGWHGVAMIEYKVSADGTPYIMEVNTRFWGSLQLAIDSGVDFPLLVYRIAMGQPTQVLPKSRTGNRLRWFLGDVDSLYISLKDRRYDAAGKLRALLDFLKPDFAATRHEVFRWDDPRPAWFELKQYFPFERHNATTRRSPA